MTTITLLEIKELWHWWGPGLPEEEDDYRGLTPQGGYVLEPDGEAVILYLADADADRGSVDVLRRKGGFDIVESVSLDDPEFVTSPRGADHPWHRWWNFRHAYRLTRNHPTRTQQENP